MAQPGMPPGAIQIPIQLEPGQTQPTQEQIREVQARITADAAKAGVSVQEFVERMRQQAMQQQQAQIAAEAEKAGVSVPEFMERMRQHAMQQQQAQIAAEAEKAGLSVPAFIEKMKAQQMQQQQMQQQAQLKAEAERAGVSVEEYVEQLKARAMEQHAQQQAHIKAEAEKAGMTPEEFVEKMKAQQMQQQQQMRQQQMQQQSAAQPGQQVPIAPGPPKPEALAVAHFLQSQDLKPRTCIFQEKRKDMFKVKRAIRALNSPAYEKARKKNPLLPEVKDRVTAENTFKLLPLSLLALRVSKHDPHEGHDHGKKKRTKGLWTVKIEPQQEARDDFHYVWLYEGAQWKKKLYAVGALALILAVVFFPVWPYHLRLGVWYLSMAMLGVLGLFFAMAIFRLILFVITTFTNAPGLWLFPNLFEDVGFFDSFKPAWAWHEDEVAIKKRKKEERDRKKAKREAKSSEKHGNKHGHNHSQEHQHGPGCNHDHSHALPQMTTTTTTGTDNSSSNIQQRNMASRVEEVDE
ncbi:Hypothetical protein R9X50_00063900 [Acrodontium crateriforme]|uniref:Translocation protein SEC62 n=1 Tax=Acrodontium crateriforme TaxID=150365 RepID=A0AAQ3LY84_9PEZI|nr:Hypothetical protein R9X50_00063900 [Acrodontium crateriforme]